MDREHRGQTSVPQSISRRAMFPKFSVLFLLPVLFATVTGCASEPERKSPQYVEPPATQANVATITTFNATRVHKVDKHFAYPERVNKSIYSDDYFRFKPLRIVSGEHDIVLQAHTNYREWTFMLKIRVQPGHEYTVYQTFSLSGGRDATKVILRDEKTGIEEVIHDYSED